MAPTTTRTAGRGGAPSPSADPADGAAPAVDPTPATPAIAVDVAVLGGGFGPALLAAVLARQGQEVALVVPEDEPVAPSDLSTVPYTAELLLTIADRFGLPAVGELALLVRVPEAVRRPSGPKDHLGFLHHRPGRTQDPAETVQFRVPDEHAEWHPDRAALDRWARDVAAAAGAAVVPTASVALDAGEVPLVAPADGAPLRAALVVDGRQAASSGADGRQGPSSGPAGAGWRTLAADFTGVRPYEDGVPQVRHPGTLPWSSGTLTHTFPGGWLQLTPHATGTCGVALAVDGAAWGADGASPAEDLQRVLGALPDVAPQFADARPVGPWTCTHDGVPPGLGTSVPIPAAAGILPLVEGGVGREPLLARELTLVLTAVLRLGAALPGVLASERPAEALGAVRADGQAFAGHQDRLVRAARTAVRSFPLWNAYLRVWLLSSIVEALALKRTRLDAAAAGDWSATDGAPGPYPFPVPDGLAQLVDDALRHVEDAEARRCPERVAAERIFDRLRRDPVVPPLYAFGDPAARTYRFGLLRRLRMLLWVSTVAPADFRRLLTAENVTGDVPDAPSPR